MPTSRQSVLMLHDVRSSNVRLLIGYPKVSSMESHQLTRPRPPGSTFISRLFHRSPSDPHDTSPSSPLDWARNLLKRRGQSDEGTELQGDSSAVVEVPYAKGKRRNASAREVAVFPDKRRMITGLDDKTLRLWDLKTGIL
ncbi:hypothetical protein BDR05DRAFT_1000102 [Suillus weaverae]|nr:hypothetical protein BDR05DRAFT_1000102 [Suillus weaverae]